MFVVHIGHCVEYLYIDYIINIQFLDMKIPQRRLIHRCVFSVTLSRSLTKRTESELRFLVFPMRWLVHIFGSFCKIHN